MTVRETLAFSARCQGVGHNYEMLSELLRREKEANIKPDPDVDAYMKVRTIEHNKIIKHKKVLQHIHYILYMHYFITYDLIKALQAAALERQKLVWSLTIFLRF
ncbi:hypothetical protein PIB30_041331 [Stylosanthes scabra]|uniref:Uncharacterized protein n=1 Tax=Stylosanthes scabra TaxID=79078 RepID=A0ABU6VGT2_9FABA|nr:hypothetical protein [Stylosanthes scabra]